MKKIILLLFVIAFTVNVSAIEKVWENLYELTPDDQPDSTKGRLLYIGGKVFPYINGSQLYVIPVYETEDYSEISFMNIDPDGNLTSKQLTNITSTINDIIVLEDGSLRTTGIKFGIWPNNHVKYMEFNSDFELTDSSLSEGIAERIINPLFYANDTIIHNNYDTLKKQPYIQFYDLNLDSIGRRYIGDEEWSFNQASPYFLFKCEKGFLAGFRNNDIDTSVHLRVCALDHSLNLLEYIDYEAENDYSPSIECINKKGEFIVSYSRSDHETYVCHKKYDFDFTKLWETGVRTLDRCETIISESGALVTIERRKVNEKDVDMVCYYTGAGTISDSLQYHVESSKSELFYPKLLTANGEIIYVTSTHIAKGDDVDPQQYPNGYSSLYLGKFDIVSSLSERVQQRAGIKVYPQPALSGNILNIDISEANGNISGIRLFDVNGIEIMKYSELNSAGREISLQIPEIAKGVYYLKLSGINSDIVPIIVE